LDVFLYPALPIRFALGSGGKADSANLKKRSRCVVFRSGTTSAVPPEVIADKNDNPVILRS